VCSLGSVSGFGEVAWQARGGKAGRVIAQEPAAGTRVPIRTSVDLVVSNGQQPELVPDVVGHQEMRAIGELASANLNATRQGRMHSPRRAGTAAALFGTLQYSVAASASACVAWLHDGTPWPMAAVIAVCGVLAWCARRFVVPAGSAPQVSIVEPLD